jgi:intraflagellar transport protein 172
MLWNRYVDLTEAIETGDSSFLDNIDYQTADAIPTNGPVPTSHYLNDESEREEVKTWVLSAVTDSSITQSFPPREKARNTLYEGFYSPDRADRPTCIVTGFNVQPGDLIEINNSNANRRDYNLLVNRTRVCPWSGVAQSPLY